MMDATAGVARHEDLDGFAAQLMVERAPDRRATLRRQLIEQEDRFGLFSARLDKAEELISKAEARILALERLFAAHGRPERAAFHESVLANHRAALEIFTDYGRSLREAVDRSSP
jgi:hypothetical protein